MTCGFWEEAAVEPYISSNPSNQPKPDPTAFPDKKVTKLEDPTHLLPGRYAATARAAFKSYPTYQDLIRATLPPWKKIHDLCFQKWSCITWLCCFHIDYCATGGCCPAREQYRERPPFSFCKNHSRVSLFWSSVVVIALQIWLFANGYLNGPRIIWELNSVKLRGALRGWLCIFNWLCNPPVLLAGRKIREGPPTQLQGQPSQLLMLPRRT